MKITRKQLKQLIKEETARLDEIMPGEWDHELSAAEKLAKKVKKVNEEWKKVQDADLFAELDEALPFKPDSGSAELRAKAAAELGFKEYADALLDWSRSRVDLLDGKSDEEIEAIEKKMEEVLGRNATPGSPDGVNEGTKITRRQLRQLITEEIGSINEDATNLPTLEELQSLESQVLRIIKPMYDRAFNTDHTLKYPEDSFHGPKEKVDKLLSKFRERNEMWDTSPQAHNLLEMLAFLQTQLDVKNILDNR